MMGRPHGTHTSTESFFCSKSLKKTNALQLPSACTGAEMLCPEQHYLSKHSPTSARRRFALPGRRGCPRIKTMSTVGRGQITRLLSSWWLRLGATRMRVLVLSKGKHGHKALWPQRAQPIRIKVAVGRKFPSREDRAGQGAFCSQEGALPRAFFLESFREAASNEFQLAPRDNRVCSIRKGPIC